MLEYYKELLLFVRNRISDRDYAQDIVQESYMKAMSIEKKELVNNKRALLYKIAKNLIIDKARKHNTIEKIIIEDKQESINSCELEALAIEENRQAVLMQELAKMPKMRRDIFVLHVLESYSRAEIASIMNISINAVEKHLSRATIELKERVKNQYGDL